jgi:hypothetical protein
MFSGAKFRPVKPGVYFLGSLVIAITMVSPSPRAFAGEVEESLSVTEGSVSTSINGLGALFELGTKFSNKNSSNNKKIAIKKAGRYTASASGASVLLTNDANDAEVSDTSIPRSGGSSSLNLGGVNLLNSASDNTARTGESAEVSLPSNPSLPTGYTDMAGALNTVARNAGVTAQLPLNPPSGDYSAKPVSNPILGIPSNPPAVVKPEGNLLAQKKTGPETQEADANKTSVDTLASANKDLSSNKDAGQFGNLPSSVQTVLEDIKPVYTKDHVEKMLDLIDDKKDYADNVKKDKGFNDKLKEVLRVVKDNDVMDGDLEKKARNQLNWYEDYLRTQDPTKASNPGSPNSTDSPLLPSDHL